MGLTESGSRSPTYDVVGVGLPEYTLQHLINREARTVRYRRQGDVAGEPGWPDPDAWLLNPYKDKLETPVDDRGLIKYDQLIADIKDTVVEGFEWPSDLSLDHMYYNEEWYYSVWSPECGGKFRELPVHKAIVPRQFENWKHQIVVPAAVPAEDVMQLRIESWNVASSLFESICMTELWRQRAERRAQLIQDNPAILPAAFNGVDIIGGEIIRETMDRHFEGVERNLERLQKIPQEFRLAEPDGHPLEIAEQLYRVVGAEALYMVDLVAA